MNSGVRTAARAFASDVSRDDLLPLAHELLARLPRNHPNPLMDEQIARFMAISDRHREVMTRLAALWMQLGELRHLPRPTQDELDADVESDHDARARPARPRTRARALALAAAVLVCAISAMSWYASTRLAPPLDIYATALAEHRLMRLPDGSEAHLAADTLFRVDFSTRGRNVTLERGEALFNVRKDSTRPFVVRAGAAEIHAVGTAFDVRRYVDRSVISVLEGAVRIESDASGGGNVSQSLEMTAGQQASIHDERGLETLRAQDIRQMASWRDGRLTFLSEPLHDVVSVVSRYSTLPIYYDDAGGAPLTYTGVVERDAVAEWLVGVEAAFGVQVVHHDDRIVIRARDPR